MCRSPRHFSRYVDSARFCLRSSTTKLNQRLDALIDNNDIENLGVICQVLYTDDSALDVLSLHMCLDNVIDHTASQYRFDLNQTVDPQTAVAHIGHIVMYIQTAVVRFKVRSLAV
jgi:hypothetical protein